MSGHNKWSQLKHKKAITDAKKSKIFSKIVRFISVEAKLAKGDINAPGLRAAIEKAKKVNMPSENIERAVKKASEPSAQMESIAYETYGPGGAGIIIEALTDNKNRTAQEIKHILSKNGFVLGGIGSVTWAFTKPARNAFSIADAGGERIPEGMVWRPASTIPLSDSDLELLDKLVDELEELDDVQEVFTNAE